MENFFKTILFIFYFYVLLFLVILDIRWDQKSTPKQIPTVVKVKGKRTILVSIMDLKKTVFQQLELSWENSWKKNVFYERK
ncbi:hypothetical protein IQB76_05640 [Leptospira borgpetersenii serovar Hardjo-bovis]|uniref:Uncharacterized protein n=1 Tax=Leptospira borgpetersenii serovar Hardjo-bovis str. Sponselee TaxID=1303729 RepID=M6BYW0_LEPBO|nr:hypothetical protein [Leptospira borgpetersenii]ABJ78753.1 Hypothetical protein LBL_1255 [Leptospira borgpetersenii serovar Hardjo-bovis str. L550]AMX58020.1 hypothetical protein LBK6_06595 [Leptospira borgpetersenii serovar Hardjo]AMX61272.1 hypothetical protein LBK9_06620 [Leptospira borgpetersenii serovar Hardjo]AMX64517.1 hypothetical protein LBK30_06675 [Leptospira borgpetersenii serovar Hardjo]AMX67735.1 hypothetical protein LBHA_06540 [Leptospira borgpetersenii serovar Hardjo]